MSKIEKPDNMLIISDLETVKIISDSFRQSILELIRTANKQDKYITVKELAAKLGIPQTKLYYHINLLEKHGIIIVAETKIVSGILEKHYRVAAIHMQVDPELFSSDSGMLESTLSIFADTFKSTFKDIHQIIKKEGVDEASEVIAHQKIYHITEEKAQDFRQELIELLEKYSQIDFSEDDDLILYRVINFIYPLPNAQDDEEEED